MKKIRLNITKIKNHFYAKIPDVISNNMNIANNDCIEVTIHNDSEQKSQVEMWDIHPEDINEIEFSVKEDPFPDLQKSFESPRFPPFVSKSVPTASSTSTFLLDVVF